MDGILIINKEQGKTSHDIVYKVKKILNEKVGHTGTLDPNATGVLPLLIGKGTQCSQYLIEHDKTYEVKLKLGIKTDTADIEGNIIEEKNIIEENLKEKWTLDRISKISLSLLKVAIYEMVYQKLPYKIAINEVIELAKKYGEDQASSFINGILASIVKQEKLEQPKEE